MRIMAEEEDNILNGIRKYIDKQTMKNKIPKYHKDILEYLRDLCLMCFGEYCIESEESFQNKGASLANITLNYQLIYPMNGMYQSNSVNRVVNLTLKASLTYWKEDNYHSISFSDKKDN